MQFYEVSNKGHKRAKAHWIIANDEEHAKKIASTQPGTPDTVVKLPPCDNIPKLLLTGKTGILAKTLNMSSFSDILSGRDVAQPSEPWSIMIEIN